MNQIEITKATNHFKLSKPKVPSRSYVDVQQLNNLRDRYHRLIDEIFNHHENTLRSQIRQSYKIDQPDTSKLKVAIDEL